jgi:hypothetical protein
LAGCPDVARTLAPLQLGVSTRGGSQSIGHAIAAALEADEEAVLVFIDYKNAFNSADRTELLKAIAEHAPALLPFAVCEYEHASRLWVSGAPDGTAPLWSRSGVRQGDPLGHLYFALLLQGPLEMLRDVHPDEPALAFLDDVNAIDRVEALLRAIPAFLAACERLGLVPVLRKCLTHATKPENGAAVAEGLHFAHCPEGVVAVGTPLGAPEFVTQHAQSKADKACALVDTLMDLPLPKQDQLLLLRMSLQWNLAHLPRTVEWPLIEDAVQQLEERVQDAAMQVMGTAEDQMPYAAKAQMVAPLRHDGLGLQLTDDFDRAASYLSAAAIAQATLSDAPELLHQTAGPQGQKLRAVWACLHEAGNGLWPEEARELSAETLSRVLPTAQRDFARATADSSHTQLLSSASRLASLDADARADEVVLARMRSVACQPASAFLDALPVAPQTRLSVADNSSALRWRLGLPILPVNAGGVRCFCKCRVLPGDAGLHMHNCSSLSGARTLRHDVLNRIWCRGTNAWPRRRSPSWRAWTCGRSFGRTPRT